MEKYNLNRCKSVFERLDSRCVLPEGHEEKHAYPNARFKKELPDSWFATRIASIPMKITNSIFYDFKEGE